MPYKPTGRPNGRPKKSPPIADNKPVLSERQWAAAFHLHLNADASQADVARAVGVSRQAVHQWMDESHFKAARHWLDEVEAQRYVKEIVDQLAQRHRSRQVAKQSERSAIFQKHRGTREQAFELLRWNLKRDYEREQAKSPGGWRVESQVNGAVFTDPQAYHDHLWQSGAFPVGHLPEPNAKDWRRLRERLRGKSVR